MAYTAAAMYGGAALDELITGVLPGDAPSDPALVLLATVVALALARFGARLPRACLAALGPIGAVLIAQALAGAPPAGDAAVLYLWPVVWSSFFFGRRGAVMIVATIALAHALVLLSLPPSTGYPGRWFQVVLAIAAVAAVVATLGERNEQLFRALARDARLDSLTGLLNRRGFDERATLALARAARERSTLALVTFDIDHFKRINDEWGHDVGDRVLARTGRLLKGEVREIDAVARLGGEEFVALLAGADIDAARAFAARVRNVLARPDGELLPVVGVSVGVDAATAPASIASLQRNADAALYHAKRSGRDRTVVFEYAHLAARSH